MRILTIAAVVLSTAVAGPAAQRSVKKPSPLEGTWVLDTINGQPTPPARGEIALVVSGDSYEQRRNDQVMERGDLTVKPAKDALELTFQITTGSLAGRVQRGHCVIKTPNLTCKLSAPGDSAVPADLAPEPGKFQFTAKKRGIPEALR